MKPRPRRPNPAVIIETVIGTLLSEGVDLRVVTLDEFKERLKRTIRMMAKESKLTAI